MAMKRGLLSDRAYEKVQHAILSGDLKPGTPLGELELASRFGIGRTPIREAVRRLRDDGLVRIVNNKGAFVERMSFTDIEDAMFVRELLEVAALHRGIDSISEERLRELDFAFERFEQMGDEFPKDECLAADVALHELIVTSAGSPRLARFHKQLADQIHRIRYFQAYRMRASIPEHRAIIRELLDRDPQRAEQALRAHLANVRDNLFRKRHLL
jgi:DNA-binding GntR family transcriptional regulator